MYPAAKSASQVFDQSSCPEMRSWGGEEGFRGRWMPCGQLDGGQGGLHLRHGRSPW